MKHFRQISGMAKHTADLKRILARISQIQLSTIRLITNKLSQNRFPTVTREVWPLNLKMRQILRWVTKNLFPNIQTREVPPTGRLQIWKSGF